MARPHFLSIPPRTRKLLPGKQGASGRRISTPGDGSSLFCIQSNMIVKQSESFSLREPPTLLLSEEGDVILKDFV